MRKQYRRTKAKAPISTKVKMLDLEKEKVPAAVRKMINNVDVELRTQARESNIPVFSILAGNLSSESFFLNHTDYSAILGDNIGLLDRMMLSAIAKTLTDDITDAIETSHVKYVGVWDNYSIYSILTAIITFMKHDQDATKLYLTGYQYAVISQEDLDKMPTGSYMPFSEYNPNRFMEQMAIIRRVAVETMGNIMANKIPRAFLSSDENPLFIRLCADYKAALNESVDPLIDDYMPEDYVVLDATEKKIRMFTEYFEEPFLKLMTTFMEQSGLSSNIINLALGMSKIHIVYDDPADKIISEVGITYTIAAENLPDGVEDKPKLVYEFNMGNALMIACADHAQIAKSKKEAFGKSLRGFILDMATYMINVYMNLMAYNNKQDEAPADGIEDMDVDNLDNLLQGGDSEQA